MLICSGGNMNMPVESIFNLNQNYSMKQLLILCLSLSLFVACKDKKDTRPDDRTKTEKVFYQKTDDPDTKEKDNRGEDDNTKTNDDSEGWSSSDVDRFLRDCEGTATPNVGAARATQYCDCMLVKMKRIYSSLADAERKMANITKTEIDELAADCNK